MAFYGEPYPSQEGKVTGSGQWPLSEPMPPLSATRSALRSQSGTTGVRARDRVSSRLQLARLLELRLRELLLISQRNG
jgi:hypothetical protein